MMISFLLNEYTRYVQLYSFDKKALHVQGLAFQ